MLYDGLQSPWDEARDGGVRQIRRSGKYAYDRERQDDSASSSPCSAAQRAVKEGDFAGEIAPVTVTTRKGELRIDQDETPFTIDFAKVAKLKPAFGKDGTVTACLLVDLGRGGGGRGHDRHGCTSEGRGDRWRCIVAYGSHAQGARVVHHRARAVDPQGARPGWVEGRGRGPLRNQRGLRLRDDDRDSGTRTRSRPRQRRRWRLRTPVIPSGPRAHG